MLESLIAESVVAAEGLFGEVALQEAAHARPVEERGPVGRLAGTTQNREL